MRTQKKLSVSDALFPKSMQAVLTALFLVADTELHLRGIEQQTGVSAGTLQRILDRFVASNLVERSSRGNLVLYRANANSPIYSELCSLVTKTTGLADPIRAALLSLRDRIEVAFIFGSFARGEGQIGSDIDVMLVGDVKLSETVSVLRTVSDKLGREINPITYSVSEYVEKLASGSHFITSLRNEPKVFLIGGPDELAKLG